MKKIIAIFILLIVCCSQISVFAATGSVEIDVPEEAGEITVCYTKIANLEEAQQKEFDGLPRDGVEYENQIEFHANETIRLVDLEEGIYQIQIQGKEEYEFSTAVVSVPMWNETEQLMEYDVRVIPKYVVNIPEPDVPLEQSPQTGDSNKVGMFIIFVMFSSLIVIMSCHKRFKCARMSE